MTKRMTDERLEELERLSFADWTANEKYEACREIRRLREEILDEDARASR